MMCVTSKWEYMIEAGITAKTCLWLTENGLKYRITPVKAFQDKLFRQVYVWLPAAGSIIINDAINRTIENLTKEIKG